MPQNTKTKLGPNKIKRKEKKVGYVTAWVNVEVCLHGIIVQEVNKNVLANTKSKKFLFVCNNQTGDQVLSINDVSLEGMTHVQAGLLLKNATGAISLQVMSQCDTQ